MGGNRSFLQPGEAKDLGGDHMVFLSMEGGSAVTDKH